FAGIWRKWNGPIKKAGPNVSIDVYGFMTTEPNALTASINHERSPVLLTTEAEHDTWLLAPLEEAFQLLRPFPADRMKIEHEGFKTEDRWAQKKPAVGARLWATRTPPLQERRTRSARFGALFGGSKDVCVWVFYVLSLQGHDLCKHLECLMRRLPCG